MPSKKTKVLVIGEVMTDFNLKTNIAEPYLVQLGGIFHAARALHALNVDYALAYYSPQYLDSSIEKFSNMLCAKETIKVGLINEAPNVVIISEPTEAGDQGYYEILRDQRAIKELEEITDVVKKVEPTDILIFPGKFDTLSLMEKLSAHKIRIHIDIQYEVEVAREIIKKGLFVDTAIFSTSSKYFIEECNGEHRNLIDNFSKQVCNQVLLKENRGGSRLYDHAHDSWASTPCFPIEVKHSVGVGDCFNSTFIFYKSLEESLNISLRRASYIASLYASTWIHKEFVEMAQNSLLITDEEIMYLDGTILPWEKRKTINIYLAAPDFPYVDTSIIDQVEANLKYHNFAPRRPIQENGLVSWDLNGNQQNEIFNKDMLLLEQCDILIAILIYDDPGTLLELGYFAKSGKPTVLYDPFYKAENLFLRKLPSRKCNTLSELTDIVFEIANQGGTHID
jgi:sugar/nucleoside kinase (ribokinase family)